MFLKLFDTSNLGVGMIPKISIVPIEKSKII
jgi:hypothetical protein